MKTTRRCWGLKQTRSAASTPRAPWGVCSGWKTAALTPSELLEHLFAYMSEHRLRASDDLFTQQLVSYVDENSNAIHYARMIVPVGPEKSPA